MSVDHVAPVNVAMEVEGTRYSILYPVIANPPVSLGAVHERLRLFPAVTTEGAVNPRTGIPEAE